MGDIVKEHTIIDLNAHNAHEGLHCIVLMIKPYEESVMFCFYSKYDNKILSFSNKNVFDSWTDLVNSIVNDSFSYADILNFAKLFPVEFLTETEYLNNSKQYQFLGM